MLGLRARIGFISPGPTAPPAVTGGVSAPLIEMEMLAPEGVIFVTKFLDGPASLATPDLLSLLPQIEPLARELVSKTELDMVLMGGAPIVLANGPDRVVKILEQATNLPATTNVVGIVNGLRRLDIQRVVVVTPYYPQSVIDMVRGFLLESGFDIVSMVSGGDVTFGKVQELHEQTYRLAKKAFLQAPSADGLLIMGGGAPLHSVIEILETDIGKPVVANTFASLWNALTLANVRQPIRGYGRLLTCF